MTLKQIVKTATLAVAVFTAVQSSAMGAGFSPGYANKDLLLNFRQFPAGGPAGTFDVTFDLGNVNTFLSTYGDQRIQINSASFSRPNAFDASLLTGASGGNYGNLNNLRFGVTATDVTSGVSDMWATRARGSSTDLAVNDSTPWTRNIAFSQGGAAGKIRDVGVNGQNFGVSLSGTAIRSTDASAQGYNTISAGGVFNTYFQGSTEGFTGASFGAGDVVRLDFYDVTHTGSGTAAATYKGAFEFEGDGDLFFVGANYVAVPEPSTYGLLAGAGVLALTFRRRTARA